MWAHNSNSEIRIEDGMYVFNAYFIKDDGSELNTGLGFDHEPTQEEIDLAVTNFITEYGNQQ
jgi:hypothetical protein